MAIDEELKKILAAGIIKEVYHPEGLANPVLVNKKSGCVDYTSINMACPNDRFPLLQIDQVVDSTSRCKTLCFLDAYSSYNQIAMKESDRLATSFITPFESYYYATMPFGLKNIGANYQCCMLCCFVGLVCKTIEAYIDDIIVKSKKVNHLVEDLHEAFRRLKRYNIKLNPEKCIFEVPRGILLDFIVSEWGIDANLYKILSIVKGVQ